MDLTDPANSRKSENARFIERVFTPGERDLIFSSPDPDHALWSVWACKEAAFKAVSKAPGNSDGTLSSSPLKYRVSLELPFTDNTAAAVKNRTMIFRGSVSTPAGILPLRMVRNSSYAHAVASTGEDDTVGSVSWVVCNVNLRRNEITPHVQSMLVRRAAKMKLAGYIKANPQDLEIVRRKRNGSGLGHPVLLVRGRESGIDISLSHDGLFLAYAFLLDRDQHCGPVKEFITHTLQ